MGTLAISLPAKEDNPTTKYQERRLNTKPTMCRQHELPIGKIILTFSPVLVAHRPLPSVKACRYCYRRGRPLSVSRLICGQLAVDEAAFGDAFSVLAVMQPNRPLVDCG